MLSPMIPRYRFFKENAGGCVGRAAETALHLARAEKWAEDIGLEVETRWDDDPDLSWMTEKEQKEPHEIIGVLLSYQGKPLHYSVWGVVDADDSFIRVLGAELAAKAMSDGLVFPEVA